MSDMERSSSMSSTRTSGVFSASSFSPRRSPNSLERQDSTEFFEPLEYPPMSTPPTSHPTLTNGSNSSSPDLKRHSPPLKTKDKKEKKTFSNMFKRSKKSKEKLLEPATIDLGMSIGTVETKQSFSKKKTERRTTHLLHADSLPRPRSHSFPKRNYSNESEGSYNEDGEERGELNSEDEFVATLVNPSLQGAIGRSREMINLDSLSVPTENRPDSRLSTLSGMESDLTEGGLEPQYYNVLVTLHSGQKLAIRDRTGSSDPYVKFKCGRFKYRSSIVHRNLNPEWNESFSFRASNLRTPLVVRVFDHDYGSLDDFMGGQSLYLDAYNITSEVHIIELGLQDPVASLRGENLGSLRLFLQITPVTDNPRGESPDINAKENRSRCGRGQPKDTQVWSSVLTVVLLEGRGLPPMDDNGLSDPYCKFKLGSQKYKSKVIPKTLNPQWMDRFDLRVYDGSTMLHIEVWDRDFPQSDDFIGSCSVDLSNLKKEVTHDLTLQLQGEDDGIEDRGSIHLHLAISGTTSTDTTATQSKDLTVVNRQYSLLQSVNIRKKKDVGFLRVKIDRAEDLAMMDTFALVELSNSCRRTQTIYRTTNPTWAKTFEFDVHDIHDELEVSVLRENKHLGKVKIPLHRIESGVCKPYALKTKNCLDRAKGVLHIECEFVYNPVRAAIRTINPREHKLLESEEKFSRKVLMNNISRVTQLIRTVLATLEFIKSFWSWEDKVKSSAAFLIFLITCLFGELWMFLLAGSFIFGYYYLVIYIRGRHVWQLHRGSSNRGLALAADDTGGEGFSDFSDLEEELETSKGRTNLREKFKQLQEVLLIVQKVLGYIGDTEERVRNLFNWSVPFLCWMGVAVFLLGSVLFYIVPLRYVILVWGINKFSKRLRNPNYISNTELLDFISRSPTNRQLEQWRSLSLHPINSKPKGGSRSPNKSRKATRHKTSSVNNDKGKKKR